jgi:hypothetical protein
MAPTGNSRALRIALPAFVVLLAWLATARADDLLDRGVRFHIAASPLASALIEFSTQSGIQVAAADADVAHLNSNGVNETLPIRAALGMLLRGTGLEFSRVGAETVAIRTASNGPPVGVAARANSSGTAAMIPAAKSVQPDPNANASATPQVPDVTVTAPRPPADQEVAGNSLQQFIVHHATVHYVNYGNNGDLTRWRGGRQSICPLTVGLSPAENAFVTARLRALASYVGAPVQSDPQCKGNVQIFFTNKPQEKMDAVVKWATSYFLNRYTGGTRDLIAFKNDHAIQGWYITTRGGSIVLNTDMSLLGLDVLPLWPQITQNYAGNRDFGTRLGGGSGSGSGIGTVILVVDTTKVVGDTIGTISDYLAMLALSVAQSPDHCDPLPSILDSMASNCGAREVPTAMTAGDIAFLKALYYLNTGLGPSLSRNAIRDNMIRQFKLR